MDGKSVARMLAFRWLLFAILALAYCFVYFHRNCLSIVADDLVTDFHATASVIGVLGSIYFYCYAAMQFPAGLLSDSVGPRRTVTVSLLLATVGSLLFGLAPSVRVAMIARAMVGLGVSMVFIPTMKILAQWFRAREFAFMSGMMQAAGGLGILAATSLLGWLATVTGWRTSFAIIAGGTLLLVLGAWWIVRDRPADKGWPTIAEIDRQRAAARAPQMSQQAPGSAAPSTEGGSVQGPTAADGGGPAVPKSSLWQGVRTVVTQKYFWPVAVWFFFDCGIFFGFGSLWSGPYLGHVYGMNKVQAGGILSMLAWGMVLGGPVLGLVSQRVLRSRKKTFVLCTSALVVLLLALTLFPAGLSRTALMIWFFLFSVCSSAIVIMGFTTTKELFPVEIAGTCVGMVNFFPFFGGAIFQPLLGWVLDACGKNDAGQYPLQAYRMVLLVLLTASVLSLACTFLMKETYRK
ncbi:MAG: MFS transporter [Planctomycetes bacterium]|jgi:sugar phosphate permease|nr:MFS transporter [Planctomycetota bacterium]